MASNVLMKWVVYPMLTSDEHLGYILENIIRNSIGSVQLFNTSAHQF